MFNLINNVPMNYLSLFFMFAETLMGLTFIGIMILIFSDKKILNSKSETVIFGGALFFSIVVIGVVDYSFFNSNQNSKIVKKWNHPDFKIETNNLLKGSEIALKRTEQCSMTITETKQINLGNGIKDKISFDNIVQKPCERVVARLDCGKNTLDECMDLLEKNMDQIKSSLGSTTRDINEPDQPLVINF